MRKDLILLSCALLAAPIIIGGAFPNVSAQERANQPQVEKQILAKEKKQKRERRGRKDKADKNGSYRRGPLEGGAESGHPGQPGRQHRPAVPYARRAVAKARCAGGSIRGGLLRRYGGGGSG